MIKSRSTLVIPPSRPRRIWLNAVGSQNGAAREEELRRSLPFCDLETGTKNRVVQRDPITGLGMLGREFDPMQESRMRSRSAKEKGDRNPILGQGDLGSEGNNGFRRQFSVRARSEYRNPIDLSGDSKDPELDALRPNNRPAKTIVQQVHRDPISGRGDFGGREWDPIRKYAGRPAPLHQPPKDERNPITGNGIPKNTVIELWHKPPDYPFRDYLDKPFTRSNSVMVHNRRGGGGGGRNPLTGEDHGGATTAASSNSTGTPRRVIKKTNPLTGENCTSFSIQPGERQQQQQQRTRTASNSSRGSNPLTGEGCQSSDSRPSTPRKKAAPAANGNGNGGGGGGGGGSGGVGGNPLTGENCASFDLSAEFRPRPSSGKGESKNPLTGENCDSLELSTGSKQRTAPPMGDDRPNILTGENVSSFDINRELRSGRNAASAAAVVEAPTADAGLMKADAIGSCDAVAESAAPGDSPGGPDDGNGSHNNTGNFEEEF